MSDENVIAGSWVIEDSGLLGCDSALLEVVTVISKERVFNLII